MVFQYFLCNASVEDQSLSNEYSTCSCEKIDFCSCFCVHHNTLVFDTSRTYLAYELFIKAFNTRPPNQEQARNFFKASESMKS